MKCCHYVLVSSFKGSLTALVDCFKISKSTQANILPNSHIAASPVVPLPIRNNKENQHLIQRYGPLSLLCIPIYVTYYCLIVGLATPPHSYLKLMIVGLMEVGVSCCMEDLV